MKTVIIFSRVSTIKQQNASQLSVLESKAKERNWIVVGIIQEKISGKTPLESRPEIQKLFTFIDSNPGVMVLVYDVSRIARNLSEGARLLEILTSKGINVHIHDLNQETLINGKTNGIVSLIINIMLSISQYQSQQIREKAILGQQLAKEKGKHIGRPKGTYKTNVDLLKQYRKVFFAIKNNPNRSLRSIAREYSISPSTVSMLKNRLNKIS